MGGCMEIRQELLLDLLGQEDARFAVPAYQRAYSWTELQCEELWRDVLRASRAGREHFVGMVLYTERELADGTRRLDIVDGQQRLVTVTLILLALAHHMREQGISFFGMGPADVAAAFLRQGDGPKLALSRNDRPTLDALVEGAPLPGNRSARVIANYELFAAHMSAEGFDALAFWRGLRQLTAIGIRLEPDDHPQAVFESLNSKGIPLTTADLVRNFLLISESNREQARLYEEYWEPIQGAFGDDPGSLKLDSAICAWLNVRCASARWDDEHTPFFVFKVYCEEEYDGTTEDLLRELRGFATMWAENFRYHGVKKYRSYNWALNGPKTLVSGRPLVKCEDDRVYEFYRKHMGVGTRATW